MRHRKSGRKLNRSTAQRRALFRSLLGAVLWNGKIVTTEAKAKTIQPQVEQIITLAKEDSPARRRLAMTKLPNQRIVEKLFGEIGPAQKERAGGYTRIVRIGPRQGDAAMMVRLELIS